jgi:methylated-DNA-protein-cysteine methyltransferase-like protein
VSAETAKTPNSSEFSRSREMEVLECVREIPEGFVRTYGDVSPGAPRFAGTVLFHVDEPDLPWWRVVRADGSLAKGDRQRTLLRAEGVPFRGNRIDMRRARIPATSL